MAFTIHSFIHFGIHSGIRSGIRSGIHSGNHAGIHSVIYSFIRFCIHLFLHFFFHSVLFCIHELANSFYHIIHSSVLFHFFFRLFNQTLIDSFMHSFMHSFMQSCIYVFILSFTTLLSFQPSAVPKNPFGGQQHFANMLGAAEQQQQMAEMLQIQMRQQTFLQQGPSSGEYESPQFLSPEPMHPQLQQHFQQQKQPLPLPPKGKKEEDMTPEEAAARKRYRRVKNNVSAKKCRDSRKRIAQTNEIVVSVFEENNPKMRDQVRNCF